MSLEKDCIFDLMYEEDPLILNGSSSEVTAPAPTNAWFTREEPSDELVEGPSEEPTEDELPPLNPLSSREPVRRMPITWRARDISTEDDDMGSKEHVQDLERTPCAEPQERVDSPAPWAQQDTTVYRSSPIPYRDRIQAQPAAAPAQTTPEGEDGVLQSPTPRGPVLQKYPPERSNTTAARSSRNANGPGVNGTMERLQLAEHDRRGADLVRQQPSRQQWNSGLMASRYATLQQSTGEADRDLSTLFPSLHPGKALSSDAPSTAPTGPRSNFLGSPSARGSSSRNNRDQTSSQNRGGTRGSPRRRIRGFGQRCPPTSMFARDGIGHGRTRSLDREKERDNATSGGRTRGKSRRGISRTDEPDPSVPTPVKTLAKTGRQKRREMATEMMTHVGWQLATERAQQQQREPEFLGAHGSDQAQVLVREMEAQPETANQKSSTSSPSATSPVRRPEPGGLNPSGMDDGFTHSGPFRNRSEPALDRGSPIPKTPRANRTLRPPGRSYGTFANRYRNPRSGSRSLEGSPASVNSGPSESSQSSPASGLERSPGNTSASSNTSPSSNSRTKPTITTRPSRSSHGRATSTTQSPDAQSPTPPRRQGAPPPAAPTNTQPGQRDTEASDAGHASTRSINPHQQHDTKTVLLPETHFDPQCDLSFPPLRRAKSFPGSGCPSATASSPEDDASSGSYGLVAVVKTAAARRKSEPARDGSSGRAVEPVEGGYEPYRVRAARAGTDWWTRATEQIELLCEALGVLGKRRDGR